MPLIEPWGRGQEVADLWGVEHWQELFERFAAVWTIPFERDVMYRGVRLFLDAANDTPPELAVSTARAGLELFSHTYIVEDAKLMSNGKYRDRQAHENIADFLQRHQVDVLLPASLGNLAAVASKLGYKTGPEIVTRLRNGVIHPSRGKPTFTAREWIDALQLSLRYLILAILSYVKYQAATGARSTLVSRD